MWPRWTNFSGEATSDAEGKWAIDVPGPGGTYRVAIDTDTIPEGFASRTRTGSSCRVLPDVPRRDGPQRGVRLPEQRRRRASKRRGTFERLLRLFVSGIRFGLIIGVCSVGLSLIYGTTGLVNFAHGELVTLGALLAWFFNSSVSGPTLTLCRVDHRPRAERRVRRRARARAVAADGAPAQRADPRTLVSIGLALFLRYAYQILFGAGTQSYRQYPTQEGIDFGPLNLPAKSYFVMWDLRSPRCSPSASACNGRGSEPRSVRSPTSAISRRRPGSTCVA